MALNKSSKPITKRPPGLSRMRVRAKARAILETRCQDLGDLRLQFLLARARDSDS